MWVNEEEKKFNDEIYAKWCEGATALGKMTPLVLIFIGFSKLEMPEKPFIVVEIRGMCINSNIDTRSLEVSYIVLFRKKDMQSFFE